MRSVDDGARGMRNSDQWLVVSCWKLRVILSGAVGEAIYETWNFSSLVELSSLGLDLAFSIESKKGLLLIHKPSARFFAPLHYAQNDTTRFPVLTFPPGDEPAGISVITFPGGNLSARIWQWNFLEEICPLEFGNGISRGKYVRRISGNDISRGKYVR